MKKLIIYSFFFLSFAILATSCKDDQPEDMEKELATDCTNAIQSAELAFQAFENDPSPTTCEAMKAAANSAANSCQEYASNSEYQEIISTIELIDCSQIPTGNCIQAALAFSSAYALYTSDMSQENCQAVKDAAVVVGTACGTENSVQELIDIIDATICN